MTSDAPAPEEPQALGFKNPLFWLMVLLLVVADLVSKNWAFTTLPEHGPTYIWGSWFGWQRLHNPGGVFGMGQTMTFPLTIVRIFAVGLLAWLTARQLRSNRRAIFTLGLLEAGAVGNLYDNLGSWFGWADATGHVRDFIRVDLGAAPTWWPDAIPWIFHPWPIFNLADSFITIGFLLLLTGLGKVHWPMSEKDKAAEAAAQTKKDTP
jgi:signal peptidase II